MDGGGDFIQREIFQALLEGKRSQKPGRHRSLYISQVIIAGRDLPSARVDGKAFTVPQWRRPQLMKGENWPLVTDEPAIATFLKNYGAHTNTLFIVKVKILVLIKRSYTFLQFCWLSNLEWLSCVEHTIQYLLDMHLFDIHYWSHT